MKEVLPMSRLRILEWASFVSLSVALAALIYTIWDNEAAQTVYLAALAVSIITNGIVLWKCRGGGKE